MNKNTFKINFQLKELDKVMPFGGEPDLSLHWFGLTDGLLWINVGEQTIYEYNEDAKKYFGSAVNYNDYQISRFLEDFFGTFRYVGESIPKELYESIDEFDFKTDRWKECYIDEDDEIFDKFYYDEYWELYEWRADRTFDSGHLVGGPLIGCFRCGEKIKILWESDFRLDNGNSIWTSQKGSVEVPYDEFVLAIINFFDAFSRDMDKQVENAVTKEWGGIELDKQRLKKENEERKIGFLQDIAFLKASCNNTDWDKVMLFYSKMESEIK